MTAAPASPLASPGPAGGAGQGRALAVRRLALRDFRNYARLELAADPAGGPVVLVGENGAGKTNLLEAVSLLAPGRGLRRARLAELERTEGGPWRVEARVEARDGPTDLATSPVAGAEGERRQVRRDGTALRSQNELAEILSMVWLTPVMDRLFA